MSIKHHKEIVQKISKQPGDVSLCGDAHAIEGPQPEPVTGRCQKCKAIVAKREQRAIQPNDELRQMRKGPLTNA
jgi:hypothetical protein